MALVTQSEIEQYSGFTYTDFTENGQQMDRAQWIAFISTIIPKVTQIIHRFCNVYSFEPATFTEYHNGRGATNFDSSVSDYNEEDMTFFLRQLYQTGLVVAEDTASKNSPQTWVTRYLRPTGPLAEVDSLLVLGMPIQSGNITITLNGVTAYTVAITAGMTITQVCAAIVAAGAQTDARGITWTPGGTTPYVTFSANVVGSQTPVRIDVGNTGISAYIAETVAGTSTYAGDYEVYQENDVTRIIFYNNIPAHGTGNVRLSYTTGYAAGSPQLNDIKFQTLRAINNILLTKKKIQEANTIRNFGVRDYSQMFDAFSEGVVLDDKIKAGLEQYRRAVIPGTWTYE